VPLDRLGSSAFADRVTDTFNDAQCLTVCIGIGLIGKIVSDGASDYAGHNAMLRWIIIKKKALFGAPLCRAVSNIDSRSAWTDPDQLP
jgi:hypothetical protein